MTDSQQPDPNRREEPSPGDWTWQRPDGGEHVYGDEAAPPPASEAEPPADVESQPPPPAEPAPQPGESQPAWEAPPPPQVPVLGPARPPDEQATAAPAPPPEWQPGQDWGQQPPDQQWQAPQEPQPPAAPWPQDPWAQQPQWGAPPPPQGYYPPQGWQQPPPAWGPPAPPRASWQQGIADLDNRLVGAIAMGGVAAFSLACCPPVGVLLALAAAGTAFVIPTDPAQPDSVGTVVRMPLILTMGFMALIGGLQFLVGLVPALGQSGLF